MDRLMDGQMKSWMDSQRMDEWMEDEWMDRRWMDKENGLMKRWMERLRYILYLLFGKLVIEKVFIQFFKFFQKKWRFLLLKKFERGQFVYFKIVKLMKFEKKKLVIKVYNINYIFFFYELVIVF